MANQEQLEILKQGVDVWNKWRNNHKKVDIDLTGADLSGADLTKANLSNAELAEVNFSRAKLIGADLHGSNFIGITRGKLLSILFDSTIDAVVNSPLAIFANPVRTITRFAIRTAIKSIEESAFKPANFFRADLREADLRSTDLFGSILILANLRKANLTRANLEQAKLLAADLQEANLTRAYLGETDLRGADLRRADLTGMILINALIDKVKLSGSSVYAVNVWDLHGKFADQKDLVITRRPDPVVTVDNIEIAQFIYLILNNEKIRDVMNTLTSKSVLILGRFAVPERKAILDALRSKLREYDFLPIVFDFDRPTDKDFTETIKTLAGLCYFVIADVTNPKSSPLELQAAVPDYQIPFVPIIQEGERPFAMMVDLQKKYNWVLNTVSYDSEETLMKILKPLIVDPAMSKRQELRLIKAQVPEVISGKDFLNKDKE